MTASLPSSNRTGTPEKDGPGEVKGDEEAKTISHSQPSSLENEDPTEKRAPKNPQEFRHEYVTGIKLIFILFPITLVYFLLMLDGSIVSTAIPSITSEFNSLLDIGWYGGAYQLASSAFQPLSGKIYTYFSTKWCFLTFFFVFEVGSALCGAAQSSVMLIVGRAIAGLGSSGLANGVLTMISAVMPPHRQPLFMGIMIGLGQIGIACGPLIGGAFTEYASWRWCFYVNLPCGAVVAALLLFLRIPETTLKSPPLEVLNTAMGSLDLLGFVLIAPAAIMFFLALQYGGNQYAWDSSTVIGLFVGAAVTFALFLIWERHKGDEAMLPFYMFRQRVIWSASGTMFFFMGALYIANYYLPIYFQSILNDSALMSGVHVLPTIIAQVILAMLSGTMVTRLGYYLPWVVLGTAAVTVAYGLFSRLTPFTPTQDWIGYQILYGAGCGGAWTMSYIAIQNSVTAAQIPIAMAILIFCQNLGGAVFLIAAQTIFSNSLREQIEQRAPGVNAEQIIAAGARSIRQLVSGEQLAEVLQAYSSSINEVMYMGIGVSGVSFVFCWCLGWKDIRANKKPNGSSLEDGEASRIEV
ncbi:MFS general substrate transporter [Hypoxylon sp. FL0890]|nr:MFS general substrate transporter [Hypoxylon sp. FL0890]